jgi:ketosteroid isomerase-like protein
VSEENVEVMRRIVAMFNEAGDIDRDEAQARAAAVFHPDVEVRDLQPPPDLPERVSGREAVVDNLLRWTDHLEEWSVEVVEYVDAEPWVICDSRWRAVGKGSEAPVEWRVAEAHEFRDGKIVREIYGFGGVDEALKALRAEGFTAAAHDA